MGKKSEKFKIVLEPGFHSLVLKLTSIPEKKKQDWYFTAVLNFDKKITPHDFFTARIDQKHYLTYAEILNITNVTGVDLSSDGKYALVRTSLKKNIKGKVVRSTILYNIQTKKVLHIWAGEAGLRNAKWLHESNKIDPG